MSCKSLTFFDIGTCHYSSVVAAKVKILGDTVIVIIYLEQVTLINFFIFKYIFKPLEF